MAGSLGPADAVVEIRDRNSLSEVALEWDAPVIKQVDSCDGSGRAMVAPIGSGSRHELSQQLLGHHGPQLSKTRHGPISQATAPRGLGRFASRRRVHVRTIPNFAKYPVHAPSKANLAWIHRFGEGLR